MPIDILSPVAASGPELAFEVTSSPVSRSIAPSSAAKSDVPHYNSAKDIPANALDAKDFPTIDAWLDACIAKGVPGKIGSGTYHVDGEPRYAPVGIYGYGETPPKFVADKVDAWLYLKDSDVTIKGVAFEGFGQPLAGCVDLSPGNPYHSTTTYAFGRFDPDRGGLALSEAGSTANVGPGVTIEDCTFINCENAFTFVSDTTQMGKVEFHNNVLVGTYGMLDINSALWTEVNATGNDWGNAVQPNVKGNGVQTGFMIGTNFQPALVDHYTKLNISNNYAHDITSVGTFQDTNAAVFVDVRGAIAKNHGDNIISNNSIVHVKGVLGQEDSNAIYAKAWGLIISDNYIEDAGAAYVDPKHNGSEATGILVKPMRYGIAKDIEVTGNTFKDMPVVQAGVEKDLAVVKLSEAVGHSVISGNNFIGGGNLSKSANAGLIRYYGTVEDLEVVGNTFVGQAMAPGAKGIVFNELSRFGQTSVEVAYNDADGQYTASSQWISFTSKVPGALALGHNALGDGFTMLANRSSTAAVSASAPASAQTDRLIGTYSTDASAVKLTDDRFYVSDNKVFMLADAVSALGQQQHVELALIAQGANGISVVKLDVSKTTTVATSVEVGAVETSSLTENVVTSQLVANLATATVVDPVIYSVSDPRFVIKNGAIYTAVGASFDYEASASVGVVITATIDGHKVSETIQVRVNDVNEAPTSLTASAPVTLLENTAIETKIASLLLQDPDKTTNYTYTSSDSRFYVKDSALYLKAGQTVDYEAEKNIVVNITASDGTFTAKTAVKIAVGDVADTLSSPAPKPATTPVPASSSAATGTAAADKLTGATTADHLFGKAGEDTLFGLGGDDILVGGSGADVLDGGAGTDTASYEDATAGIRADLLKSFANLGDAAGDRYVSIENLTGSAFDDMLSGNNGRNVLIGGAGADKLLGYGGVDILMGGDGNDQLFGHGGADILIGGSGNDLMDGGAGGPDTFVFAGLWGSDTITSFEAGLDKLDFSDEHLTLSDLKIAQTTAGVTISVANHGSILLADLTLAQFNTADLIL